MSCARPSRRRQGRELSVTHPRDAAAERPDPEVPGAVLVEREDLLGREAVGDVVGAELPVLEAGEAVADRADPERALPVDAERRDPVAGQALRGRVAGQLARAESRTRPAPCVPTQRSPRGSSAIDEHRRPAGARSARRRMRPDASGRGFRRPFPPRGSAAVLEDRPDLVVGQPFAPRVVDDALALEAIQSAVGRPDPEAAVAVLVERQDPVRREPVRRREAREGAVPETVEAVRSSRPRRPLPVAVARRGRGRSSEAVRLGVEARAPPSADVDEPAPGPDPEAAARRLR